MGKLRAGVNCPRSPQWVSCPSLIAYPDRGRMQLEEGWVMATALTSGGPGKAHG